MICYSTMLKQKKKKHWQYIDVFLNNAQTEETIAFTIGWYDTDRTGEIVASEMIKATHYY